MTEFEVPLHGRAPKIEVPVLQAQFLVYRRTVDLDWRWLRRVKNAQFGADDLNLACIKLGIRHALHACSDTTFGSDDELRADVFGPRMHVLALGRIENNLGYAPTIPHINENHAAVVPVRRCPTHEYDLRPDVRSAQIPTPMGA
jgi:hypothetical protein